MNPAYGFVFPRLTGDALKDERRTRAIAAIIDWWQEASSNEGNFDEQDARLINLLNWASVVMIDARSDFLLPPLWQERPTWGTLRTHAKDGGGLTVRMLQEVATQLLYSSMDGHVSLDRPEGRYKLGLAWRWAILAHAAGQVLRGKMEVAEFQKRFMDEPPLRIPAEERERFLRWVKNLNTTELEEMVKVLHLRNGWCREGILSALENLDEVTDDQIQQAAKALWDEDFQPLSEAVKAGAFDIGEILSGGES